MKRDPYKIRLYKGPKQGYGCRIDPRSGRRRFYISYETVPKSGNGKPRREVEWIDVENLEQAKEERYRRYTELLLHGAEWKGRAKKIKPKKKKKVHPDQYLCKQYVRQVYWTVKIGTKYIGGSRSKMEARRLRDAYLRDKRAPDLKPCPECGQTPTFTKNHWTLEHDNPECPLRFRMAIRDVSKVAKISLWNNKIRRGNFRGQENIYMSDIEHLL